MKEGSNKSGVSGEKENEWGNRNGENEGRKEEEIWRITDRKPGTEKNTMKEREEEGKKQIRKKENDGWKKFWIDDEEK